MSKSLQRRKESGRAGSAIYTKSNLRAYDLSVLWLSNNFAWRCPTSQLLDFYNQHISGLHLDVGVGTGFFLDNCQFPVTNPSIMLMDLNRNTLEMAGHRINRYSPTLVQANVLNGLPVTGKFDSIGINYLLHCLPGNMMQYKRKLITNLRDLLNPGGVLFGSTILGQGVRYNMLAKTLASIYNATGVFDNNLDNQSDLNNVLSRHFQQHTVRIIGCVALFAGRI